MPENNSHNLSNKQKKKKRKTKEEPLSKLFTQLRINYVT